jgi:hypothetical protein
VCPSGLRGVVGATATVRRKGAGSGLVGLLTSAGIGGKGNETADLRRWFREWHPMRGAQPDIHVASEMNLAGVGRSAEGPIRMTPVTVFPVHVSYAATINPKIDDRSVARRRFNRLPLDLPRHISARHAVDLPCSGERKQAGDYVKGVHAADRSASGRKLSTVSGFPISCAA